MSWVAVAAAAVSAGAGIYSSSQANKAKSTTTSSLPPEFMAAYNNVVGRAQGVSNQPLQPYTGDVVAGWTPAQLAAFDTVNNTQGLANPFYNSAAQMTGDVGNTGIGVPTLSPAASGTLASSAANTYSSPAPNYLHSAMMALPLIMGLTGNPQGGMPGHQFDPSTWASQGAPSYSLGSPMGSPAPGATPSIGDVTGGMVPGLNAGTIGQYMDPYTQQVVSATQEHFNRENEKQRQQLIGNAITSGAWGGDRAGIAQGELSGAQASAQNPIIAGLYSQGYQQALAAAQQQQQVALQKLGLGIQQENIGLGQQGLNYQGLGTALGAAESQDTSNLARAQGAWGAYQGNNQTSLAAQQADMATRLAAAQQQANLGTAAVNTNLGTAQAQLSAGTMQQQLTQNQLNAAYQQYAQAQAYPMTMTDWLAKVTTGLGSTAGGTTTSTTPGPNALSQGLGAGLSAYSLFGGSGGTGSLFGSPSGGGYATLAGNTWTPGRQGFPMVARGGRVNADPAGGLEAPPVSFDPGNIFAPPPAAPPPHYMIPQIPIGSGAPGSTLSTVPVSNYHLPTMAPVPAVPAGAAAPVLTPGMQAAKAYANPKGGLYGTLNQFDLAKSVGLPSAFPGLSLFKKNRAAIGDIAAALAGGATITDAQWAKAGYGPEGAALTGAPATLPAPVPFAGHGLGAIMGRADGGEVQGFSLGGTPFDAPDLPEPPNYTVFNLDDMFARNDLAPRVRTPRLPSYGPPKQRAAQPRRDSSLAHPGLDLDSSGLGTDPSAYGDAPDAGATPDSSGDWRSNLMKFGLALAAGDSPYFGVNMGRAGLATQASIEADKDRAAARQAATAEYRLRERGVTVTEKNAKAEGEKLAAEIAHWAEEDRRGDIKQVEDEDRETQRVIEASADRDLKREDLFQRKQASESEAEYRARMAGAAEKNADAGRWTFTGVNEEGKGIYLDSRTGEEKIGEVKVGAKPSATGTTPLMKNAQFFVEAGLAKTTSEAISMLRSSVTEPTQRLRILQAEKARIARQNVDVVGRPTLNEQQIEQQAEANLRVMQQSALTERPGGEQPADQDVLPPEAAARLKEGIPTTFANAQVWTLRGGQPVRLK